MPAGVEVHAAVGELGPVVDGSTREEDRRFGIGRGYRQTLSQGLHAMEHPCGIGTIHLDLLWRDVDVIGLGMVEILRCQP